MYHFVRREITRRRKTLKPYDACGSILECQQTCGSNLKSFEEWATIEPTAAIQNTLPHSNYYGKAFSFSGRNCGRIVCGDR